MEPNTQIKPRILLLGDDIRLNTGVANISRLLVMKTANQYEWYQMAGGMINNPDLGKILDLSKSLADDTGIDHAKCILYPVAEYGNPVLLRQVIAQVQPHIIIHFTDPRYWGWLYEVAPEFRQAGIPLAYINIWDSMPDPLWNTFSYESCDLLMAISKQTYGINVRTLSRFPDRNTVDVITTPDVEAHDLKCTYEPLTGPMPQHLYEQVYGEAETKIVSYIPHGVDLAVFKKYDRTTTEVTALRKLWGIDENVFIVLANGRNIQRKRFSTLIMAFNTFAKQVGYDTVALVIHTEKVFEVGTNLPVLAHSLAPLAKVVISDQKYDTKHMPYLYNACDVFVSVSSAEGWGVPVTEAHGCELMSITAVTGGLQDQIGFASNDKLLNEADYVRLGSLHDIKQLPEELEIIGHSRPIWASVKVLNGSPQTPFLYDDFVSEDDLANELLTVFAMEKSEREHLGSLARTFVETITPQNATAMTDRFSTCVNECIRTFKPIQPYLLFKAL